MTQRVTINDTQYEIDERSLLETPSGLHVGIRKIENAEAVETWNRRTPDLRALITQAIELARENAYVEYCPDEYAPCHEVHYADTTAEILSKLLGEK